MSQPTIDTVRDQLRGHTRGDLQFSEHVRPLKYVIAPDGRLVAPVMVAMIQSTETVLFIPEMVDDSVELLVSLYPFEEEGPEAHLTDRWRIYHGDPEDVRWAFLDIDAAKLSGLVIDGAALVVPNPLADAEAALCRWMNSEFVDELRQICKHFVDADVEAPVMVGIDERGIDVRRAFDVVRVPAIRPMSDDAEARTVLGEMIAHALAGETAAHG